MINCIGYFYTDDFGKCEAQERIWLMCRILNIPKNEEEKVLNILIFLRNLLTNKSKTIKPKASHS